MPTIAAGASTAVVVAVGTYLNGSGPGNAVIGAAAVFDPLTAGEAWQIGPFDRATSVGITATGAITYEVKDVMRTPSEADKLPVASVAAVQALVSQDGIMPRADTLFPPEKVQLTLTGTACAAPCYLHRIRCLVGTTIALVVYDNPHDPLGTQLYSGTLSAGQEAVIPAPIRAINGPRGVFTGTATFEYYISQGI